LLRKRIIDAVPAFIYYINELKTTLPQRLECLFADLGINQVDFAQKTGYGQSYISLIMNGSRNNPRPRFFDTVCREYNVNHEWLKTGKGDIYVIPGVEGQTGDAELIAKFRLLPKSEQRLIEELTNALLYKSMSNDQVTENKEKRTKKKSEKIRAKNN
jgi:transcriptional regulator with XRE-family HTH domain